MVYLIVEIVLFISMGYFSILEILKIEELKKYLKEECPKIFDEIGDTEIKSSRDLYLYKTLTRYYYESRLGKVDIAFDRFLKSKRSTGYVVVDTLREKINFYSRAVFLFMFLMAIIGFFWVFKHGNY